MANLRFLTFLDLARKIVPGAGLAPSLPGARRSAPRAAGPRRLPRGPRLRPAPRPPVAPARRSSGPPTTSATPASRRTTSPDFSPTPPPVPTGGSSSPPSRPRSSTSKGAAAASPTPRASSPGPGPRRFPSPDDPLLVYGLYDLGGLREGSSRTSASARPVLAYVPDDGEAEPAGGPPRPERALREDPRRLRGAGLRPAARRRPASSSLPPTEARRERPCGSCSPPSTTAFRSTGSRSSSGIPSGRKRRCPRSSSSAEHPYFRPAGPGFSRSPLGRAARALVRLAAEDFPADAFRELLDLLETLGLFPGPGPAHLPRPARLGPRGSRLRGRACRPRGASRPGERAPRATPPSPRDDPDGWFASRREAERAEIRALESAVNAVAERRPDRRRRAVDRVVPPAGALLRDPVRQGGRGRGRLEPALEALAALEAVEPGAVRRRRPAVATLLPEALDLSPERRGRFERDGVALLSAVSARGLLFDAVLVPGLVEQSFPRPVRPDPLLFDAERRASPRRPENRCPTRADERPLREERFLFGLARAAARKRLVLLAAARDVSTDRPRLLSPFLLDLAGDETRRALLSRELGHPPLPLPEGVAWHPAGRLVTAGPPLDAEDALRRALALSPGLRKSLPGEAAAVKAALARGRRRRRLPFFTPYEGERRPGGRPGSGSAPGPSRRAVSSDSPAAPTAPSSSAVFGSRRAQRPTTTASSLSTRLEARERASMPPSAT